MRSSRVPQAFTCGLAVLLITACTSDAEPPAPPSQKEPSPIPTAFEGEAPPGIEGEVLRYLHGDAADVHEILDDPFGVRISPVGDALLISSGGEDRHLLHDAATGETLWEGQARFRGFDTDRDGGQVLLMADTEGAPFVLDARGETVWEPAEEGDVYLDGLAVRRPDEWSSEEPFGAFSLLDAEGDELWSYDFEAPPEPEEDSGEEDAEEGEEDPDESGGGPEPGVPVAVSGDLVLLAHGGPGLNAYSVDPDAEDAGDEDDEDADAEKVWAVDGEDADLGLSTSAPAPAPQVLGFYPLPGDEPESPAEEGTEEEDDTEDDGEDADEVLLLRWAYTEAPSVLTAHDPRDGDLVWSLEEPGTNPVADPFHTARAPGGLHDAATGTLLLSQASGAAPMIAIDLATGEVLWGLEEEAGSISPAFAFDGLVYGDSRASTGEDRQLVLDAVTMDVVEDELPAYVEAVTESGHAVLVQDRQRFVYGPPPQEEEPSPSPNPSPSDDAS